MTIVETDLHPTPTQHAALTMCKCCCSPDHPTYACPEIAAALLAEEPPLFHTDPFYATLAVRRAQIAHQAEHGYVCTAQSLIADTLNLVERWLEPEALTIVRQEQLTAARASLHSTATDRDLVCGF